MDDLFLERRLNLSATPLVWGCSTKAWTAGCPRTTDRYWEISARPAPAPHRRRCGIQRWREGPLHTCQPTHDIVHREHPNVLPQSGLFDDLTDMGISATRQLGRELFSRITRSTCGKHGCRQTRSRAQTLRCPILPADASRSASMATSRASSEIEGFGPRRFAGGRSAVACCRDFMA